MLKLHHAIFTDELGTVLNHQAVLQVHPDAGPKFYKARPVPFATKDAIGAEIDRLEAEGTDPWMSKVVRYTKHGWPTSVPAALKPFDTRRNKLTVEGDCLLWEVRVTVPQKLQGHVLAELHSNHPGTCRMKSVARSYVWWPEMDQNIEDLAKSRTSCQSAKNAPAVAPLHPWVWPTKPWQRIHVNFASPFLGKMFYIIVDAHSKWPKVDEMSSTSTAATIEVWGHMFASFGLPLQLVSDNRPQFVSAELALFLKVNEVKHIRCAPYHSSSNGCFVQTFKQAMRAGEPNGTPLKQRLDNFLLRYRSTPHTSTMLLIPPEGSTYTAGSTEAYMCTCADRVAQHQAQQVQHHDQHAKSPEFAAGQEVMARNFRPGSKWVPGTIKERLGQLTYLVQVQTGDCWKRHVDHILRGAGTGTTDSSRVDDSFDDCAPLVSTPQPDSVSSTTPATDNRPSGAATKSSTRIRQPPDRYGQ